jgi:large subunit ribosomal protein L3
MTKLWVNDKHTAVTLLEIVPQEVVRFKTSEKDGYEAAVIGVGKKDLNKEKGHKVSYELVKEFGCDDSFKSTFPAGTVVAESLLEGVESVDITGVSKGKGFS